MLHSGPVNMAPPAVAMASEDTAMDNAPAATDDTAHALADNDTESLMRVYYDRLFPYHEYYDWLSYGVDGADTSNGPAYFANREFSFTIGDDIYIRYQSFLTCDDFEQAIRQKRPKKIDIGAVFNTAAKNHNAVEQFYPVAKEVVFDIDVTDYDDIPGVDLGDAKSWWPLMDVAVRVMDDILRNDFGFEHIMYVFSGRRGVHGWVCDERARMLNNDGRSAIAEYLQVYRGGDNQRRKVLLSSQHQHPTLNRVYKAHLEPFFKNVILDKYEMLQHEEGRQMVLEYLQPVSQAVAEEVRQEWARKTAGGVYSSRELWNDARGIIKGESSKRSSLDNALKCVVMHCCWPRLDINVSKQLNHLLKAPFCVHPKTGRVCIPVEVQTTPWSDPAAAAVDIEGDAPTIQQLSRELNSRAQSTDEAGEGAGSEAPATKRARFTGPGQYNVSRVRGTAMEVPIQRFHEFLRGLWRSKRSAKEAATTEF